jgi:hypothetical protein
MPGAKASQALLDELEKNLKSEGPELVKRVKVRAAARRPLLLQCSPSTGKMRPQARGRSSSVGLAVSCVPPPWSPLQVASPTSFRIQTTAACAPRQQATAAGPPQQPPPINPLPHQRPAPSPPPHLPARRRARQGLVVFDIDGDHFSLDLREGNGSLTKGKPDEKPDLTLTMTDANFVQLVMGKLNPQQVRSGRRDASCVGRTLYARLDALP